MDKVMRRWGYADIRDMAWVAAHQCMIITCMVFAPIIGHLPVAPLMTSSFAIAIFFYVSEGTRRAVWRREVFSDATPPFWGSTALAAFAVCLPMFCVMWISWAAYGFASGNAYVLSLLGIAYGACAASAVEAVATRIRVWRRWFFKAFCVALQPVFLFGPLFRPDPSAAAGLYRLSMLNPIVPGIEPARAALSGAPLAAISLYAFFAWVATFAAITVWCGGGRSRRDLPRY